jgi:hydroxyacylglutathione hydrolase
MLFLPVPHAGLAQVSYLVGCQATGEAIVIDPMLETSRYEALARQRGLRITWVTETHIHADYVSGVRALAAATGAQIALSGAGGPMWQYAFATSDDARLLHDGDRLTVGNVWLDVWHTPGHTPEHLAFLVTDSPRGAGPLAILSGDCVFVGDVGRPDLLERAAGVDHSMRDSAADLFRSIARIRTLPDWIQLWPGHGAGSACGKALGAVPSSTIGYERRANWAFAIDDLDTFVDTVLDGQVDPPAYFARMKQVNREGPPRVSATDTIAPRTAVSVLAERDHVIPLDIRPAAHFADAFMKGSVSLPLGKSFATWAGSVVPADRSLVIIADDRTDAHTAALALREIGLESIVGYATWADTAAALRDTGESPQTLHAVDATALADLAGSVPPAMVIDVRTESERAHGTLPHAVPVPFARLAELHAAIVRARFGNAGPLLVHCQSGGRSPVAVSVLLRFGAPDVRDVRGGYAALGRAPESVIATAGS